MAKRGIANWRWVARIGVPLILFSALIGLGSLLILHPLTVALSQALISLQGEPFAGNFDLVPFLLSPVGVLTALVLAGAAILLTALQFGGLTLIAWDGLTGQKPGVARIWFRLGASLPSLLVFTSFVFVVALALILPVGVAAFAVKQHWLSGGDIYFYVTTRPPEFYWAAAVVGGVALMAACVGILLVLRWFLAVPFIVVGGAPAFQSLKLSAEGTKGRRFYLLLRIALLAAVPVALAAVASFFFTVLFNWLLDPTHPVHTGVRTLLVLAVIASVSSILISALSRALFAVFGAGFYASALGKTAPRKLHPGRETKAGRAMLLACIALPVITAGQIVWAFEEFDLDEPAAVTAHRAGSLAAPENTLAALERAIADGADFAEIDVQETSDGEVIVVHDTDFRRVAGVARPVWELSLADVRKLDAGAWFRSDFAGERIPTLREFALAAKGRIRLNVEVKVNGHGQDLAARTVSILKETGIFDATIISSLDLHILADVRRIDAGIPIGFIASTGIGNLLALDVDFYSLAARIATPATIGSITRSGRSVHVWSVETENAITDAVLDGAQNVITDNPAMARKTVDALYEMTAPEIAFLRMRRLFERRGILNRRN